MSPAVVPTSSAVRLMPSSVCTSRPNALKSSVRSSTSGRCRSTPLPPPNGRSASAFLNAMPWDRRNASLNASCSDAYFQYRQPPNARAPRSAIDSDDGLQAGKRVGGEHDTFMSRVTVKPGKCSVGGGSQSVHQGLLLVG